MKLYRKFVKIKWVVFFLCAVTLSGIYLLMIKQEDDLMFINDVINLQVTSNAFSNAGAIPIQYTGFGNDISPSLNLSPIHEDAVSIAIIMDDLDVPFVKRYNHWVIWNIPVMEQIQENIPYGSIVGSLDNANQGIGYGKNRYRGPKPPAFIRGTHRYEFHVFVLDCTLDLNSQARKKDLLEAIDGHILQHGCITGVWSNAYLD
ncbi:MAG: YbhB/YbcL family Raf kinase inhibitor-like protein [Lachnospiraceae bacterium]